MYEQVYSNPNSLLCKVLIGLYIFFVILKLHIS